MLRAYSREIVGRGRREPRGQHVHPGARLHVRAQPDRSRGRARGARGRRVEVFALQADPPQLRPHHRLLARSAAALLDVRDAGVGARARHLRHRDRLSARAWPTGTTIDTVCLLWDRDILAFFLIGMLLFGLGLVGEYVGRIYQQVRERPRYTVRAVLERAKLPRRPIAERNRAMTRAVVFAYHNVGVRCLGVLLAHGVEVPLRRRRTRTTRARRSGSTRSPRPPPTTASPRSRPTTPMRRRSSRASRRSRRISCSRSITGGCWAHRCSRSPPRGALNMHGSLLPKYRGPRAGELGGARRRTRDRCDAALHGRETGRRRHRRADGGPDPAGRHGARRLRQGHGRGGGDARPRAAGDSSPAPRRARRRISRAAATSAAAARRTASSTGRATRRRSTTSSAPSRRPIRAHSRRSAACPARILRTRVADADAPPTLAPTLAVRGARLVAQCGGGGLLHVHGARARRRPVSPAAFATRFGPAPALLGDSVAA